MLPIKKRKELYLAVTLFLFHVTTLSVAHKF